MDPPSALQSAMRLERKPFTYTPGGLDLSEIKSERMAKRLMRNALSQGVPELPPQLQSPTTPTTPIAVPNYNALPVQVFPTFNLPANPKSLLRTRSTPDRPQDPPLSMTKEARIPKMLPPTQTANTCKPSGMDQLRETLNNNTTMPTFTPSNNNYNSRPIPTYDFNSNNASMYEFNTPATVTPNLARTSYGSNAYTAPMLPEISYDAEYYRAPARNSNGIESINYVTSNISQMPSTTIKDNFETVKTDITVKSLTDKVPVPETEMKPEDIEGTDDDQKTVKVVKKQIKSSEKKVENESQKQNGDQNGDAETEMVVKLPAKKSAATTETNVEVVKKTLPDGSVEETKTTTTKTTVDGKTSISTKTETTIIPKEPSEEVEEEEEEETTEVQEIGENGQTEEEPTTTVIVKKTEGPASKETVVKKEERSETTTTKKVVVVQQEEEPEEIIEEEEEEEEMEETEPKTTVVIKKAEEKGQKQEEKKEVVEEEKQVKKEDAKIEEKQEKVEQEEEDEEEEEEEVEEEVVKVEKPVEKPTDKPIDKPERSKQENVQQEEEEEVEEEEETEITNVTDEKTAPNPEPKQEKPSEPVKETKKEQSEDEESEYTEEEYESEKEDSPKKTPALTPTQASAPETPKAAPQKVETKPEGKDEDSNKQQEPKPEPISKSVPQSTPQPEPKVPLREPSIPLEKVEDVEIKPIGAASETISKTHTERTEIISSDKPAGGLSSTQTEYNRIENIVTVNRTTKTLDHSYEQITQQGIPTVKTYFPPGRERVSTSPQPARPYQPLYTPSQSHAPTERRHSLLLERLSMERQMPSDIYQKQNSYHPQYSNQAYEQQRQWSQEPQSEVVNDPNIKPSKITNQQWYQQSRKENVIYNNVSPSTPAVPSQQWSQPQPQVPHQPPPQPQPQYQSPYFENTLHESSNYATNTYQQNSYPGFTPAPAPAPGNWASSNVGSTLPNSQSNQYSFLNKTTSENYQQNQQNSSSYVPPPWEQDPNYVAPELPPQNFYQPPPSSNTFSPSSTLNWKPTPPAGKFSKPAPKSFIPPAPNQSFVKSANSTAGMPPKRPGSKTYYSEYERRYITVPESTYIPADAKFQPQPDPSPQYYYDNNEPNETVEHQWRKELREFTEKTQTQTQTQTQSQSQMQTQHTISEQSSLHPPWEEDPKYSKVPSVQYTPTPSWSQTVRPQSYRETNFESEYVTSNDWSKTNTLGGGRNRPVSIYGGSNVEAPAPERHRGVSLDRYNPNKYQSPLTIPYDSEHGPVQAHTLDPTHAPHRGYHNPNVPAYHARASAEPREQQPTIVPKPSNWGGERATPIQSRSFKYLQWITGTED